MATPAPIRLDRAARRHGWRVTTMSGVAGALFTRGEVTVYVRFDTHGRVIAARIGENWLNGPGKADDVGAALAQEG